ncbi:MAG: DEAD/DEAH box helicase [Candidatus Moraniibacteriota bacterium]|nr:MAG: DEAD/DEAH box helicase [Candidatus Moranbacteria bacterium]
MSFHHLGIAPGLLAVLDELKFITPTPIQERSIPIAITGKDVMGIAQTGTGKTLAFGIPMIGRILEDKTRQGLIMLPTRELALQVDETFQRIGRKLGIRTAVLIGGDSMEKQKRQIRANPHVIIATPGRLNDHLGQRTVTLEHVRILVLDEADHMLDMGFAPQIAEVVKHVPKERQTMLFSATMPNEVIRLATSYLQIPIRVEVAPPGTAVEKISQELFFVPHMEKLDLLLKLLGEYSGSVLVFTRTKFIAKRIALSLRNKGHQAVEIHSNRSLSQRREALDGFKAGRYRVMVATDIAARGIDVSGIEVVINYDLPEKAEDYVHRIGRTARAGREGRAISFATPDQKGNVRDIERLMRITLPIKGGVVPEGEPRAVKSVRRVATSPRSSSRPGTRHFGRRR